MAGNFLPFSVSAPEIFPHEYGFLPGIDGRAHKHLHR
jgi:hypothetical protein